MRVSKHIRKWILVSLIMTMAYCVLPNNLNAQQTEKSTMLIVALLPILDAFPYYVAEANGYFDDFGVSVKAVPVASGLERDQLMQSGAIDGMLNELITTANFWERWHETQA